MEAFYFGDSKKLFGIFHPPLAPPKTSSVLIVPPLFSDYVRSHRTLRKVAMTLQENGFPTLRFDFRGAGDSLGELAELTRDDWVADIVAAATELRELSGIANLSVITARYSALLLGAASGRLSWDKSVCWDPELAGDDLLREANVGVGGNGPQVMHGFVASSSFVESWRGVRARPIDSRQRSEVLTRGQSSADPSAEKHYVDFDCRWKAKDSDDVLYAHDVIRFLCDAL